MTEIWKAIPGYEGLYEVSDQGRVRGLSRRVETRNRWGQIMLKTVVGTLLAGSRNKKGYRQIHLCKEGVYTTFRLSRLVAKAFIPNPENKPQVNHLDGDLKNNAISNLEWATNDENQRHSWAHLNRQQSGPEKRPVIASNKKETRYYPFIHAAAKDGISASHICKVLAGRGNTCRGFSWHYATPEEIQFYEGRAA
jgi:hypothetical protein